MKLTGCHAEDPNYACQTYGPGAAERDVGIFELLPRSRYHHIMKTNRTRQGKARVGVGLSRMKVLIKELRKQYGPMLKRLAS